MRTAPERADRPDDWTSPESLRERLLAEWDSGRLPTAVLRWSLGGAVMEMAATAGATATATATVAAIAAEAAAANAAAAAESDGPPFPLRLSLQGPSPKELGERFDASRKWIARLSAGESRPGYSLEWRELRHQQLGRNSVPVAARFDSPDDALRFAGRLKAGEELLRLSAVIGAAFPELYPWMLRRPLVILEQGKDWPAILGTLAWFRSHPRPGLFARQIDAPGVHSKFVEGHRSLLAELLDLVLEDRAIDRAAAGAAAFNRRYGLRDKPQLVRFRSLDPAIGLGLSFARGGGEETAAARREDGMVAASPPSTTPPPAPTPQASATSSASASEASPSGATVFALSQVSIEARDFARFYGGESGLPFREVFITENEINFLAFPERRGAIILFGAGYGFGYLAEAVWLANCRLRYWGDLDTHGFAILDQFRALFPDAESFLMDRETLLAHRELWTVEGKPTSAELTRLDAGERSVYDALRGDLLAPALRLEQERIRFSWLEAALARD